MLSSILSDSLLIALMPVYATNLQELKDAAACLDVAAVLEFADGRGLSNRRGADYADAAFAELLELYAMEVASRQIITTIGAERLSLHRMFAREAEIPGGATSRTNLAEYRHTASEMDRIVRALNVPDGVSVRGGHKFESGEELVLLLYRRLVSTDSNAHLAGELGRCESAISEGVAWLCEYLLGAFGHLVNEESLLMWEAHFDDFAAAYADLGLPVDNCILLVDGKLYKTCRPVRGQRDIYSGHHHRHGCKALGITLPNGIQPFGYFHPHGRRHDVFNLEDSGLLDVLDVVSQRAGTVFRAGADSGFPVHRYLTPMYTRAAATPVQQLFNHDYSVPRVQVEWGFRKIVQLFPYVDYHCKLKLLRQRLGILLPIAVLLTNIHTCVRGDAISDACGMQPPQLEAYLAGNV